MRYGNLPTNPCKEHQSPSCTAVNVHEKLWSLRVCVCVVSFMWMHKLDAFDASMKKSS